MMVINKMSEGNRLERLNLDYDVYKTLFITILGILLTSSIASYNVANEAFRNMLYLIIVVSIMGVFVFFIRFYKVYNELKDKFN